MKLIHISWKSEDCIFVLFLSIVLCPAGEDKKEMS